MNKYLLITALYLTVIIRSAPICNILLEIVNSNGSAIANNFAIENSDEPATETNLAIVNGDGPATETNLAIVNGDGLATETNLEIVNGDGLATENNLAIVNGDESANETDSEIENSDESANETDFEIENSDELANETDSEIENSDESETETNPEIENSDESSNETNSENLQCKKIKTTLNYDYYLVNINDKKTYFMLTKKDLSINKKINFMYLNHEKLNLIVGGNKVYRIKTDNNGKFLSDVEPNNKNPFIDYTKFVSNLLSIFKNLIKNKNIADYSNEVDFFIGHSYYPKFIFYGTLNIKSKNTLTRLELSNSVNYLRKLYREKIYPSNQEHPCSPEWKKLNDDFFNLLEDELNILMPGNQNQLDKLNKNTVFGHIEELKTKIKNLQEEYNIKLNQIKQAII